MTSSEIIATGACIKLGYQGTPVYGSTTDSDVARATTKAFARQRQNFPLVCGSSPREEARRNRRFHSAVEGDAKRILGITVLAVVMGLLGGPLGVVLAVIGAVFQILLEKEIEPHFQQLCADAAMEPA